MTEKEKREKILRNFIQNPSWPISSIAKECEMSRRTTANVIKRFRDSGTIERRPGSGRKVGSGNTIREKKIVEDLKKNPELSLRDLGRKYGTSHSNVLRIKQKYGGETRKKYKVPNRNQLSNNRAILRARRLNRHIFNNFSG